MLGSEKVGSYWNLHTTSWFVCLSVLLPVSLLLLASLVLFASFFCFHPCCCLRSRWCFCPSWSWHPCFSCCLCKLYFTWDILDYRTIRPRLSECFFLLSDYRNIEYRIGEVYKLLYIPQDIWSKFWYIELSDIGLSKNNRLPKSEKQSIESLISNIWRACKVKSRSASYLNQTSLHSCPADSAK